MRMSENDTKNSDKLFQEKKQIRDDLQTVFENQDNLTPKEAEKKAAEDRRKAELAKHEASTMETLSQENAQMLEEKEKGHFIEDR